MSQDGELTSAFVAAVEQVKRSFELSDLARIRHSRIKKMTNSTTTRQNSAEEMMVLTSVWPCVETNSYQKEIKIYELCPFYYAVRLIKSRFIPYMEIVEIPVFFPPKNNKDALSKLEKTLEHIAIPAAIPFSSNSHEWAVDKLWKIREHTIRQIFDYTHQAGAAYLSLFVPPKDADFGDPVKSYMNANAASLDMAPWERHHVKMVSPFSSHTFRVFEMQSFALGVSELKRFQ